MEETPVLQIKINNLTAELLKTKTVLDQTRELLKSAEQENNKLKEALQDSLSSKKNQLSVLGKVIGQLKEVTDKVKFQSPIVKKES